MPPRFLTADGLEVPAVTAAQMREVDRIAVEETGPTLLQMMEHAGRSLALEAIDRLGDGWREARIVVLAGIGGNGGGGICAARHLVNRGVDVRLCLADAGRWSDAAGTQLALYRQAAGLEVARGDLAAERPALVIDAVLGYSLRGAPRGPAGALICWAGEVEAPILSLDVPSGVDATSGETPGDAVRATWTLTLALPKTGLRASSAGGIVLADLGIPAATFRRAGIPYLTPFGRAFRVALRPA